MEYSPPPLFKQGASARVKMMVFAGISIGLLLVDSRMHALTAVRQAVGTVLYPVQMAALVPRDVVLGVGNYFSSISALEKQVHDLKLEQIASAQVLQQAQLNIAENNQLRKLMEARERVPVKTKLAEILYDTRDSATRKIVLDRGLQDGVELGRPVIDNQGVVGQITRVFPFTSEVTLLTDEEQAIPVQVLRNGVRSVAYGRGKSGAMELRFTEPSADIQIGDIVITSGLDGLYPAGLAVARVTLVERNAHGPFGRVVCQPLAGIERNRQLLILMTSPEMAPRPPVEDVKVGRKIAGKMAPIKDTATAEKPPASTDKPAAASPAAAKPATTPAARPAAPPAATPAAPAVPATTPPKEATR